MFRRELLIAIFQSFIKCYDNVDMKVIEMFMKYCKIVKRVEVKNEELGMKEFEMKVDAYYQFLMNTCNNVDLLLDFYNVVLLNFVKNQKIKISGFKNRIFILLKAGKRFNEAIKLMEEEEDKSKKVLVDLLDLYLIIKDDDKIQDTVLELAKWLEKNNLNDERYELLSKFSKIYKNNLKLQELIPQIEASENITTQAFDELDNNELNQAEKKLLLAIQKDEKNKKAYEGLTIIYKKQNRSKELSQIAFKRFNLFKDVLKDNEKLELLEITHRNDKDNLLALIELKVLQNVIPLMEKLIPLEKTNKEKDEQIKTLKDTVSINESKILYLQTQLARLSIGKPEKLLIFIDRRKSHFTNFNICGIPWKLKVMKNITTNEIYLKLFHLFPNYHVSISGSIEQFVKKDSLGITRETIQSMNLKCPIGDGGWKLYNIDENDDYLSFEISITISSIILGH